MPHKCVRCGNLYENAQLNGCSCGSQLFFFVKTMEEADSISHVRIRKKPKGKPKRLLPKKVKFGGKVETIHVSKGVYEINLDALMKEKPIILHDKEEKRYSIDLKSLFKSS